MWLISKSKDVRRKTESGSSLFFFQRIYPIRSPARQSVSHIPGEPEASIAFYIQANYQHTIQLPLYD
jgi:hypothetical protein